VQKQDEDLMKIWLQEGPIWNGKCKWEREADTTASFRCDKPRQSARSKSGRPLKQGFALSFLRLNADKFQQGDAARIFFAGCLMRSQDFT
jgi:hypothetical protein